MSSIAVGGDAEGEFATVVAGDPFIGDPRAGLEGELYVFSRT